MDTQSQTRIMTPILALAAFMLVLCVLAALAMPATRCEAKTEEVSVSFDINGSSKTLLIPWDFEQFGANAKTCGYKMNLAIAGAVLSRSVEVSQGKAKAVLKKLGFKSISHVNYDAINISRPAVTFATSSGKVKGRYVVAVVCRGTSNLADAYSDVQSQVDGFAVPGANAKIALNSYMKKHGLTKENTTLFLTGHSYGAAVAGYLSLVCNDLANQAHTFAYTFATPNFNTLFQNAQDYPNVFYYVNGDDTVPNLPVGYSKVGVRRYFKYAGLAKSTASRFEAAYKLLRGKSYGEDTVDKLLPGGDPLRDHQLYTYLVHVLTPLSKEKIKRVLSNGGLHRTTFTTAKSSKAGQVTLEWTRCSGSTGYVISVLRPGHKKYQMLKRVTKNKTRSYTVKNLSGGKVYHFRIRTYKVEGKTTRYSSWSVVRTVTVRSAAKVKGVKRRASFSAYSWAELKKLANAIAKRPSKSEALKVAKYYQLVNSKSKLTGKTKKIKLANDTVCHVRILGFRHDKKVGGGKAGISFEFADIPAHYKMNSTRTTKGGWKKSVMRSWLNSTFYHRLPTDLRKHVVSVAKRTNNVGATHDLDEYPYPYPFAGGDIACIGATNDKLWLLSLFEVFGKEQYDSIFPATYDAEGEQYKLYVDKKVNAGTFSDTSFCKKNVRDGKHSSYNSWWLRSPDASGGLFHIAAREGWFHDTPTEQHGVSPGFCF